MSEAEDLPAEVHDAFHRDGYMPFELPPEGISIDGLERKFIIRAMERTGWVTDKTAPLRGMSFKTLLYRLETFGIFRH